jgi:cytolysin-activating lysine-acyltransferase
VPEASNKKTNGFMAGLKAKTRKPKAASGGKAAPAGGGASFASMAGKAQGAIAGSSAGKTVSAVLGEITWLMSQSPKHRTFMIGDLEALVMPAILLRQFRLWYEKAPQPAAPGPGVTPLARLPDTQIPVGVALYARLSPEAAARLDAGAPTLRPGDWNSGSLVRIIDLIAPFGGREEMEREFQGAVR